MSNIGTLVETDLESCHVRFVDELCGLGYCKGAECDSGMSHCCSRSV